VYKHKKQELISGTISLSVLLKDVSLIRSGRTWAEANNSYEVSMNMMMNFVLKRWRFKI
jgi:hypothetical protein